MYDEMRSTALHTLRMLQFQRTLTSWVFWWTEKPGDHSKLSPLSQFAHLNPADLEVPEPGDGAGEHGLPPLHHRHVVHAAKELGLKILAKTSWTKGGGRYCGFMIMIVQCLFSFSVFRHQTERNRIKNFDLCYGTSLLHGFKSLVFTNAVNCVAEKIAILFESKLFRITHREETFSV